MPEEGKKAAVTPVLQKGKKVDPGNSRPVSLTSMPGKVMEQLMLNTISKQMKDKKVIRSSQHGFLKRDSKNGLSSLGVFSSGITRWVAEGRAVAVVSVDFRKAFDTVSHNILRGGLSKCNPDEWRVLWTENWLNDRAQRAL